MKRAAFLLVMAVVGLASCGKEENVSYNERRGGRNLIAASSSDYSIDFSQVQNLDGFKAEFEFLESNNEDEILVSNPDAWELSGDNLIGSYGLGKNGSSVALLKRPVPNAFEIQSKFYLYNGAHEKVPNHSSIVLNYVNKNSHLAFYVSISKKQISGSWRDTYLCTLMKRKTAKAGGGYQAIQPKGGWPSGHCGLYDGSTILPVRLTVKGKQVTAELTNPAMKVTWTLTEAIVHPIGLGGRMKNLSSEGEYRSFSFIKR